MRSRRRFQLCSRCVVVVFRSAKCSARDRHALLVTGSPIYDFMIRGQLYLGQHDLRRMSGQVGSTLYPEPKNPCSRLAGVCVCVTPGRPRLPVGDSG